MTEKRQDRRGLGRGLSALMADVDMPSGGGNRKAETQIPIERIHPNPDQPRRTFVSESLEELAASIGEKGVIQPLILRNHPDKIEHFQIVAGERRWRAAQMAQLHEVPAIVRDLGDTEMLEVAIIENIQRADLNPVDEAAGYRQLMDRHGHTQENMAKALGKSRSHIANALRLLNLPPDVQSLLATGQISMGHARALVTADDPSRIAREVIAKGLSVRETEALMKRPAARRKPIFGKPEKDADTKVLETDLSAALGLKVTIDHAAGKDSGKLVLNYRNLEQLDDLCRLLSGG